MHFVYGFCNGNAHAAVEENQRRFPDRRIPFRCVFTRINQTLRDTGCLPSVAVRYVREVVRKINTRENILEMVQGSPRLFTRRMASCIGVSSMQVWGTLHEEDLYPYHHRRVQRLMSPRGRAFHPPTRSWRVSNRGLALISSSAL